jgi:hypothetical protein
MSSTRTSPSVLSAAFGLAVLVAAPACDDTQEAAETKQELPPPPAIKVELPPPPDFDEGKSPETWDDGAYSIYGLRQELDHNIKEGEAGKEVLIKGYVQEIYVAPECPPGEVCPPPKQPHVWITDKPDEKGKKRAMMVVNYRFSIPEWDSKRWKDEPQVILEKGRRYTFKGKFKRFSDTGFAYDRGLLEFVAYRPLDPETGQELATWIYPPAAPWHPIEIARQEEENARLAEKAKESATPQ